MNWHMTMVAAVLLIHAAGTHDAVAQNPKPKAKTNSSQEAPFRWVNEWKNSIPGVTHATFKSPSMGIDVGYCIYVPPAYTESSQSSRRFPVVYYLHGGRPGSETKSVKLAATIHQEIASGKVPPMIYVFVNGGPVSHYNMPDRQQAMGEDVFVKELIPHIDATYRTIASRNGRGLEGFSQGGRGTARIMFKHPELFCSAAPGGAGQATEKRISEENGKESETLIFTRGYNTWDLAREFSKRSNPGLRILVYVGTEDSNFEGNLEYIRHLESLQIPHDKLLVTGIPHNAQQIYDRHARQIMTFHSDNFAKAAATE